MRTISHDCGIAPMKPASRASPRMPRVLSLAGAGRPSENDGGSSLVDETLCNTECLGEQFLLGHGRRIMRRVEQQSAHGSTRWWESQLGAATMSGLRTSGIGDLVKCQI